MNLAVSTRESLVLLYLLCQQEVQAFLVQPHRLSRPVMSDLVPGLLPRGPGTLGPPRRGEVVVGVDIRGVLVLLPVPVTEDIIAREGHVIDARILGEVVELMGGDVRDEVLGAPAQGRVVSAAGERRAVLERHHVTMATRVTAMRKVRHRHLGLTRMEVFGQDHAMLVVNSRRALEFGEREILQFDLMVWCVAQIEGFRLSPQATHMDDVCHG